MKYRVHDLDKLVTRYQLEGNEKKEITKHFNDGNGVFVCSDAAIRIFAPDEIIEFPIADFDDVDDVEFSREAEEASSVAELEDEEDDELDEDDL